MFISVRSLNMWCIIARENLSREISSDDLEMPVVCEIEANENRI